MLSSLVLAGFATLDGARFGDLEQCPFCAGPVTGYDWKPRLFATITEGNSVRDIVVQVKRFSCARCGRIASADAPFYPDTRIGSPVVDLCVILSRTIPFSRAAAYLAAMGILIDRGSCRNYAKRNFGGIRTIELFGVHIPLSILSLSLLASRNLEGGPVPGAEALAACGFPSAHRAAPDLPVPAEKRNERDEQEQEEERQSEKK
jgi:hypothetical protein